MRIHKIITALSIIFAAPLIFQIHAKAVIPPDLIIQGISQIGIIIAVVITFISSIFITFGTTIQILVKDKKKRKYLLIGGFLVTLLLIAVSIILVQSLSQN